MFTIRNANKTYIPVFEQSIKLAGPSSAMSGRVTSRWSTVKWRKNILFITILKHIDHSCEMP